MGWLFVVGIVVFLLGLMVSIALHEIGHLVPAKLFGVKVTQYMVGFGPTMWSRRRGETQYGIKWFPFGGYIRMIGMLPPRPTDDPNKVRSVSTGPWQALIENARDVALEEVEPGDEDRVFYRKPWWQKVIIMAGGPAMNFVLAFVIFAFVIMTFGVPVLKPVVATMTKCVIPYSESLKPGRTCTESDPLTPAVQAGVKVGDRIVSFDGTPVSSWEEATKRIRGHGAGPVVLGVVRDGKPQTLNVTLIAQDRPNVDDPKKIEKNVGFLGVAPTQVMETQGFGYVVGHMVDLTGRAAQSMINLPEKMVGVWNAAFSGEERDPNGPVGVVGAGRIGGEIAASSAPAENKLFAMLSLLAGFNLAIGMFNLIPLLPLDGGHIAGGLWEGIKRAFARVTRRPEPRHVDIAKVLPLTYALAFAMMIMFGLLLYADLVNPLRLG
ncbi:M50 family metallopeptidase [Streptosporangium carneum]|uniref:Zinc metalloprotease n=1 Tax=Streptosporangium carneum TaxID=47481 RepID=A0A9W6I6T8_9ACTN|nr:M50 family metallopeptidase [Streptosporangium carneum]GLK12471.1 putative zinc metalloprotease [Streptosporangium carneum]